MICGFINTRKCCWAAHLSFVVGSFQSLRRDRRRDCFSLCSLAEHQLSMTTVAKVNWLEVKKPPLLWAHFNCFSAALGKILEQFTTAKLILAQLRCAKTFFRHCKSRRRINNSVNMERCKSMLYQRGECWFATAAWSVNILSCDWRW